MIRITVRLFSITVFLLGSYLAIGQTSADYNKQARTANEKGDNDGIINAATLSLNVALNGEAYWWRAIGYKNKKNYTLAISDATKAMSYYTNDNSSTGRLYELRANAYYELGDYDYAVDDMEKMRDNYGFSKNKTFLEKLVLGYVQLQEFDNAVSTYSDIIKLTTSNIELSDLYFKRALVKNKDLSYTIKEIMDDLDVSITKNRQNIEALYERGVMHLDNKRYALCKTDMLEVVRVLDGKAKNTNDTLMLASSHLVLGAIYYDNKNYDEAKASYVKTLKYNNKSGFAFWNLGRIRSEIDKDYEAATADYKKAITLLTTNTDRVNCYIDYYLHERRYLKFNKAMEVIDAAIIISPNDATLYWDKAYLYKLKNDKTEALRNYNKAFSIGLKDSTQRAGFYLERGQFKLSNNDPQGALLDIQNSIALRPGYNNYKALGDVFKIGMKQTELANGNYQKAMSYTISGTQKKDTSSNYAYAAAAMGDKVTAERFIKKMIIDASAKIGALADEYHNAACIYTTLGNFSKAFEYLELSLQAGYNSFEHMLHDADLEPLYKLPEYKNLLVKYKVPVPVY
ncbi:MAG: TPR end-of-group domain-containing protein [Sediminibacterium sp.]